MFSNRGFKMRANVPASASWRDSARAARFWIFDASAAFPLVFMLFNIKWSTFVFALVCMFFLKILDYYGFKIIVFLRIIRNFVAGDYKSANPWWL
jgi:intracellular multiplication protein IcmT